MACLSIYFGRTRTDLISLSHSRLLAMEGGRFCLLRLLSLSTEGKGDKALFSSVARNSHLTNNKPEAAVCSLESFRFEEEKEYEKEI